MRVVINPDLCEAHGLCEATAPGVFELQLENDTASVVQAHPDESLRAQVVSAARLCPKQAISVFDD